MISWWECVEMRDFERLFLSVGRGRRVDSAANSAWLCNAKGEGRKVSLNDVMSDLS